MVAHHLARLVPSAAAPRRPQLRPRPAPWTDRRDVTQDPQPGAVLGNMGWPPVTKQGLIWSTPGRPAVCIEARRYNRHLTSRYCPAHPSRLVAALLVSQPPLLLLLLLLSLLSRRCRCRRCSGHCTILIHSGWWSDRATRENTSITVARSPRVEGVLHNGSPRWPWS